jgi:predicted urease superfamily metal-dependent hydrolase
VRTGYLEVLFGSEVYSDEIVRRARQETAGTAAEFVGRYPGYDEYLTAALDGWDGREAQEWAGVGVDEREDMVVECLKARGRGFIEAQEYERDNPEPSFPAVMFERATESREEAREAFSREEREKLEELTDEELRKHWAAYEQYVKERFPDMFEIPFGAPGDEGVGA